MENQSLRILFDSKNEKYKKPFGALKVGQVCYFGILVPESCPAKRVFLVLEKDEGKEKSFEMRRGEAENLYVRFETEISLEENGLYFYRFYIEKENGGFSLFKQGFNDTNMEAGEKWQITCYDKKYVAPEWAKGAVIYQIFPDRFHKSSNLQPEEKLTPYTVHKNMSDCPIWYADKDGNWNNDFFGGNLEGITEKLDYISEVGASIIYLNPIVKAFSNHRYDTADYKAVDPMLGTTEDFKILCRKAHERNIRIVIDGVFSHTGNKSIYFEDAVKNENSPYRDWYDFKRFPDDYTSWWGIKTLPQIKKGHRGFIRFIADEVIPFWLDLGADGIRLDVADELTDYFIERINESAKKNKDALIIGEVWEDASNKISYGIRRRYFHGTELDSVMNYPFLNSITGFVKGEKNADVFANEIMTIAENYPPEIMSCCMNILSTHDTVRILTLLGTDDFSKSKEEKAFLKMTSMQREKAKELLKIAAFLQFMLPGAPSIYYGDEIGMEGFEDPFNRRFFEWDNVDYEIFNFYKSLCRIKNTEQALKSAGIKFKNKSGVLIFKRENMEIVVNMTDIPFEIKGEIVMSHNANNAQVYKNGFALIKK